MEKSEIERRQFICRNVNYICHIVMGENLSLDNWETVFNHMRDMIAYNEDDGLSRETLAVDLPIDHPLNTRLAGDIYALASLH